MINNNGSAKEQQSQFKSVLQRILIESRMEIEELKLALNYSTQSGPEWVSKIINSSEM